MKIFCIGQNKTGTTSLKETLKLLGYTIGCQRKGELLLDDYLFDKWENIIKYCDTAEVFQDIPFSKPKLYKILDLKFKDAKFILTVRNSSEDWYNSLINFHKKHFYKTNNISLEIVKNINYIRRGWIYSILKKIYKAPDNDLYNKEILCNFYEKYNKDVIEYFKHKPDKLLIINLANKEDFIKLKKFLNIKNCKLTNFLHLNKT